jgi:hypothetical protein
MIAFGAIPLISAIPHWVGAVIDTGDRPNGKQIN